MSDNIISKLYDRKSHVENIEKLTAKNAAKMSCGFLERTLRLEVIYKAINAIEREIETGGREEL